MTSSTIDDTEYVEFAKDEMGRDDNPALDGPPFDDRPLVEVESCGAESEYGHECGEVVDHDGNHICCEIPEFPCNDFDVCGYEWVEGEE